MKNIIWAAVATIAAVVMAIVAVIGLFYKKDKKNSVHTKSVGNESTPNTNESTSTIKNANMGSIKAKEVHIGDKTTTINL